MANSARERAAPGGSLDGRRRKALGSRAAPIEAALRSVEDGLLAVEEIVAGAAKDARFRAWLTRRLNKRNDGLVRRLRLRRSRTVGAAVASRAVSLARGRLKDRNDIVSVHWGARRVRGRVGGRPGVTVLVRQKLPREELMEGSRIPSEVMFRYRGANSDSAWTCIAQMGVGAALARVPMGADDFGTEAQARSPRHVARSAENHGRWRGGVGAADSHAALIRIG